MEVGLNVKVEPEGNPEEEIVYAGAREGGEIMGRLLQGARAVCRNLKGSSVAEEAGSERQRGGGGWYRGGACIWGTVATNYII